MSDKRRARRRQLDASHQRNWLTGRYAVTELLLAGRWPILKLWLTPEADNQLSDPVAECLRTAEFPMEVVDADRLTQLSGSRHHQGLAAQLGPFPYQSADDLPQLLASAAASRPPLVVLCDRIQDAHNLGAILRSCDAMAVTAVVIGEREQVGMTPQVVRSSAGAVNHLAVVRTEGLVDAARRLVECGLQLLAASEKSSIPLWQADGRKPTALVIGSEAHGVADSLLQICHQSVAIPMLGQVGSLNAAVAAGMLLYELRRGGPSPA